MFSVCIENGLYSGAGMGHETEREFESWFRIGFQRVATYLRGVLPFFGVFSMSSPKPNDGE